MLLSGVDTRVNAERTPLSSWCAPPSGARLDASGGEVQEPLHGAHEPVEHVHPHVVLVPRDCLLPLAGGEERGECGAQPEEGLPAGVPEVLPAQPAHEGGEDGRVDPWGIPLGNGRDDALDCIADDPDHRHLAEEPADADDSDNDADNVVQPGAVEQCLA